MDEENTTTCSNFALLLLDKYAFIPTLKNSKTEWDSKNGIFSVPLC